MTPDEKKVFLELTGLKPEDLAPDEPVQKTIGEKEYDQAVVNTFKGIANDKDFSEDTKLALALAGAIVVAKLKMNLFGEDK